MAFKRAIEPSQTGAERPLNQMASKWPIGFKGTRTWMDIELIFFTWSSNGMAFSARTCRGPGMSLQAQHGVCKAARHACGRFLLTRLPYEACLIQPPCCIAARTHSTGLQPVPEHSLFNACHAITPMSNPPQGNSTAGQQGGTCIAWPWYQNKIASTCTETVQHSHRHYHCGRDCKV